MDKLREFWRTFKRIHFWVVCGLIALVGIVSWFLATKSLRAASASNKSAIEQTYQKAVNLRAISPYPNAKIKEEMEKLINSRVTEIHEAWQKMESQQKDAFSWPDIENGSIREQLKDKFPIEQHVAFPLTREDDVLTLSQLEAYREHIHEQLRMLASEIGSEWTVSPMSTRVESAGGSSPLRDLVVTWEQSSQKEIQQKHFTWDKRGTSGGEGIPNTLEVLYAQEDLWVLRALTGIIKRTNGAATTAHSAKVRRIVSIRIGEQAVANEAAIYIPEVSTEDAEAAPAPPPVETPPPPEESSETPAAPVGDDPAEGRYVDKNYNPLPAMKLREVMSATSLAPEDAYLAVAKRIPIRMTVRLDQRAVNDLLVECANSHPTVEIRQVRMPLGGKMKSTSGTTGFDAPDDRSTAVDDGAFPFDVALEVYGIVYIYNSAPSEANAKSVFGVGGDAEAEGAVEGDGTELDEGV